MTVQWWCAARGVPWTGQWQAYPGIWLFIAAVGGTGAALLRASDAPGAHPRGRRLAFGAGLLVLWAALDWPLGALGAGYLLTAHTLQYLAVTGVAAPLLLWGLEPALAAWAARGAPGRLPLRGFVRPLGASLTFGLVLVVSHVPPVVDRLLVSPAGTFVMDLAWLGSALVFWWPLVVAKPGAGRLAGPGGLLYLFVNGIPSHALGALLTLAPYPLYALYELAPRVGEIGARADQQVAGVLMWVGAPLVGLVAMTVVFFSWARGEEDDPALRPVTGAARLRSPGACVGCRPKPRGSEACRRQTTA
jgi:cytochrome c oxidase assembly factor CtaG